MDAPIPEQSRRKLQDLFMDDTVMKNQREMIVPKCEEAVKNSCTPSNSDQYFVKQPGCQNEVKKFVGDAFDEVFTETGHVMTFWDDFAMNVTHKVGLTYRELATTTKRSQKRRKKRKQCYSYHISKESVKKSTGSVPPPLESRQLSSPRTP